MTAYKLHFVPLGGITGVTKNMYLYELYENETLKDILIVDCGIGFPQEKEFGVDFVIPDISYLKGKTDKIRAVLLTHGHEDHISALPYHYNELGKPQIFSSKLTVAFIENKFKESRFIEQIMVVGEGEKFAAAFIQPDFLFLKDWCETKNIDTTNNTSMITNPKVIARIKEEVDNLNKNFAHYEQLKKFELLETPLSIESGELTPTLKLKRKNVLAKNKELYNKMYLKD